LAGVSGCSCCFDVEAAGADADPALLAGVEALMVVA
jgi:hypothetical protein